MLNRRQFLAGTVGACLPSYADAMRGPILVPDQPWEGTCAMPFSGGIWNVGGSWRCYYLANYTRVCLAFSDDGLTWMKPDLGIIAGTNVLLELRTMDSFSVWLHEGLWHMTISQRSGGPLMLLTSRNGIRWHVVGSMGWAGDRTTFWFNPAKDRWTFNVRNGAGIGGDPRRIDRVESETFIPKTWTPQPWLRARVEDGADEAGSVQLYALDVVPMADRLIGLFTLWRGQPLDRPKLNDVCLGFSTDGETWTRHQQPILTYGSRGQWNFGNVQSVGHGVHYVNGKYRLYASGRSGQPSGNGVCALGYREVDAL